MDGEGRAGLDAGYDDAVTDPSTPEPSLQGDTASTEPRAGGTAASGRAAADAR